MFLDLFLVHVYRCLFVFYCWFQWLFWFGLVRLCLYNSVVYVFVFIGICLIAFGVWFSLYCLFCCCDFGLMFGLMLVFSCCCIALMVIVCYCFVWFVCFWFGLQGVSGIMLAFGWIILIDLFDFRDYCAFDCVVLFVLDSLGVVVWIVCYCWIDWLKLFAWVGCWFLYCCVVCWCCLIVLV